MSRLVSSVALLVVSLLTSAGSVAGALESLGDEALADVSGREGIAVDMDLYLNSNPASGVSNGQPLASLANCSGIGNGCRIALQFNNRLNAGGEWLVLKDVYGSMLIRNLFIDGAFSQLAPSSYADSSRFLNGAGVCLPNPAVAAGSCASAVLDKPMLQMSFQSVNAVGGNYTTFEPDLQLHLNIGRVAVEYGATGYNSDARGSFMGVLISDTQQLRARADIDGRVFLTGF
jgi:hypothetical protein